MKRLWAGSAVCGACVIAMLLLPLAPQQTADDSAILSQYLDNLGQSSVLGASSEQKTLLDTPCPIQKPIIGWINFDGDKVIRQSLPDGESPSACFNSIENANQAGFLKSNGKAIR